MLKVRKAIKRLHIELILSVYLALNGQAIFTYVTGQEAAFAPFIIY